MTVAPPTAADVDPAEERGPAAPPRVTPTVASPATERLPGESRRVATSATSQLVAKGLHFGFNAISTLAIVRYLGPARFGDYVFVVTASFVIGLVADMGLNNLAVREIARDPAREDRVIGSVLLTRLALGVGAWVAAIVVVRVLGGSGELLVATAVISVLYFTEAALAIVIRFHVRVEQQYEAVVRVVMEGLETLLVLVLIARGASLIQILAAPPAAAFVGVALATFLARRRYGPLPRPQWTESRGLLHEALPVGLTLLLAATYLRSPALVVASVRGSTDAGYYGAAYQPIEYLLLASAVVINVLLPLLSRAWISDSAAFLRLYARATDALLALTIPVAVAIVIAGPALLRAVFGSDFEASATPLRLLGLALVPMVMSFWHSIVLLAGGQQRLTLAYDLLALVVTLTLCAVLVPPFGPAGAAGAVLVTSVVVVVCAVLATRWRLHVTPDGATVVLLLGLGATSGGIAALLTRAGLAVVPAVAVAVTVYGAALWRLGLLAEIAALGGPASAPSRRQEVAS